MDERDDRRHAGNERELAHLWRATSVYAALAAVSGGGACATHGRRRHVLLAVSVVAGLITMWMLPFAVFLGWIVRQTQRR